VGPGNYPEENIQPTEQGENLKSIKLITICLFIAMTHNVMSHAKNAQFLKFCNGWTQMESLKSRLFHLQELPSVLHHFWALLQNCEKRLLALFCLSACQPRKTRFPLVGFS
jgi:hypothetical protein